MLRHDHIGCDVTAVPAANLFEFAFEDVSRSRGVEQLSPLITTECYEVQTLLLLKSLRLYVHGSIVGPPCRSKVGSDKGGATRFPEWERSPSVTSAVSPTSNTASASGCPQETSSSLH